MEKEIVRVAAAAGRVIGVSRQRSLARRHLDVEVSKREKKTSDELSKLHRHYHSWV